MNRRLFLVAAGAFVATNIFIKKLPESNNSTSIVWPKTKWELNEHYDIYWTGFYRDPYSEKRLVGKWIAHPSERGLKNGIEFSAQSIVVNYEDEITHRDVDVQTGLDTLLEFLENGERVANKHKIKGSVPMDSMGNVNKNLLSLMRREHIRKGIWPQ